MDNNAYITTPIYYVNDEPHQGHAYTTILADVMARYSRLQGKAPFFLVGTDEHGQKVQDAARSRSMEPRVLADQMVERFRTAWQRLHVEYDDFIRTTENRHVRVVTEVLQKLWVEGDIYMDDYEGWYCVPDERFWTEKDVADGACPDCQRPVEWISEKNYFFRMGRYQDWLLEHIESHPDFIQPAHRRNEVLGYLRKPLSDLCISRPVERLSWGAPLPFDSDYVTYVWFDALLNYLTAAGYLSDDERFARLWPTALHLIGKDILITHAVYWPTMLKAIGLPPPRTIFAHGWWLVGGAKVSKSLGNAAKPLDLADRYGADAVRFYLMRGLSTAKDASFDEEELRTQYNALLANDLGNLAHRLVNMIERYCDGRVPDPGEPSRDDLRLRCRCEDAAKETFGSVASFAIHDALANLGEVVSEINSYVERRAPWKLAKEGKVAELRTVLYHAAEALRLTSVLHWPVMPERMAELWRRLGWEPSEDLSAGLSWGGLRAGTSVAPGPPLFPKNESEA